MLGTIIGDIVGSRWEFNPTNDYNFEWLSNKNGYTDDTICTVAVADALLQGKSFGDSIHEWCRRYPHPMGGYGGRFLRWVHSDHPEPYGSFGNGSAMRVSPVAYWYSTEAEVLEAAKQTAECSHNHQEGIKGAQTVALAIFKAMQFNRHRHQEAPYHIDEILNACVEFSGYDINMPKSSVLNRFDETCQGTVPVALKIIGMATCFEDAVRMAVSLGADADTLGAIVGSIAESIWGIPLSMRQDFTKILPSDMQMVLLDFQHKRPDTFKPLIDTTFSGERFTEAAWDVLDDAERHELMSAVGQEKEDAISLMADRAKARYHW